MVDLSRGTVDGVDISQHQLDLNNHLSTKILGDIEEYDLGKSVYDLIICWDVVEHLPNPASALKIFFRAIKPNGIIIVGYPAKCCDVKIMQWNQRYTKCAPSLPEPGSITRATTLSFWRGSRMMQRALTTLIGSAGQTALFAPIVAAPRRGA